MKLLYTILIGVCVLSSCQNVAPQKDNVEVSPTPNKSVSAPLSLANLFTPNEGVFRGSNFSSTPSDIQQLEKSETLVDESGNKYSIDINDTDFADFEYFFNNGKMNKIQVDVFSTNTQIYKEVTNFFNAKYKVRKSLWEGSENGVSYTVYAKQVKNGVYVVYELL